MPAWLERLSQAFLNRQGRARPWVSIAILLFLTEAVYLRPSFLAGGGSLLGMDYFALHIHRIAFAQEALFGPAHFLPAWYPRELLGSPFLANLQNFPWIPTRLILLFFDPLAAYAVGVAVAAALAALFTYLYCRRAGLSEIGAVTAGWTFACAGFFASRVMAGHLPLLEAYPALPLLLWLADRAMAPDRSRYAARDLAMLALAAASVAAAGHPQLPAYSLATAALYIIPRGGGWRRLKVLLAMALGVGTTLVLWWPMFLLIQRSTRMLELAAPSNDVVMPLRRLAALILPGIDGWPDVMELTHQRLFEGYLNSAYFWDTCSYVGLLPVAVLMVLLFRSVLRKRLPRMPWAFLTLLGSGALLFSLRLTQPLRDLVPGTFFRSPARLLYLFTFAAAVALGFAVTAFLNSHILKPRARQLLVTFCLLFHLADLGGFARQFVRTVHWPAFGTAAFDGVLAGEIKGGRIAADDPLAGYDDAGGFDSILLANPYRAILGVAGEPPDFNEQQLDGSSLPIPALQMAGVRFVITEAERPDLQLVSTSGTDRLYRVSNPVPRAAFFAMDQALFLPRQKLLDAFLAQPRRDKLLLPAESRAYLSRSPSAGPGGNHEIPTAVTYSRPSSDEIRLHTAAGQAGFVHMLESWDPGWSAQVDSKPGLVAIANGFSMAVPVEAGEHAIRLRYQTAGRTVGWILSIISAGLLALLIRAERVTQDAASP
ncbi:MAG: hypothetical protein ABSC05_07060 [Candidatus Solibacter sp.]|jgi:hypothetical protein